MAIELTRELIEKIEDAIAQSNNELVLSMLEDVHAEDINAILYEIDTAKAKYVIELLDVALAAEIVSYIDTEVREKFLKHFHPQQIAAFLEHIDSDDAADIVNEQASRRKEEIIAYIQDREKANNILELIRYDEDCAGGLMAKEMVTANVNWKVSQCVEEIRRQAQKVAKIHSVYVVDDNDKLLGRIPLKELIITSEDKKVADILIDDIVMVETITDVSEVTELMKKYDLEAIPVVNIQGKLVGRITIDDVIDVITEQAEMERQYNTGIIESVESTDSVWTLTRARLPWLIIGMVGGMLGAKLIGVFEPELIQIPAMAFFIPLITATGGNVGIQSSSLVIQSLMGSTTLDEGWSQNLIKSLLVSIINGIAIGIIAVGADVLIHDNTQLSIVVGVALFCVVLLSSLFGTITPYILDKCGVNPALASGPFITTANDILGLAVYFSVAHFLLIS